MPHFVVDCSESVLDLVPPQELMRAVYIAAEATGLFAASGVGGIKVRIHPFQHVSMVDDLEHFVHVFANIMEGRTQQQKKTLARNVVASLKRVLPSVEIISMNVREFEKATYCNAKMIAESEPKN